MNKRVSSITAYNIIDKWVVRFAAQIKIKSSLLRGEVRTKKGSDNTFHHSLKTKIIKIKGRGFSACQIISAKMEAQIIRQEVTGKIE